MNSQIIPEARGRTEIRLFVIQRLSAMILAPLVLIHLATMIYAIQDGLTASEILSRTKGSIVWGIIYGLFIVTSAIHASLGLRTIIGEMTSLSAKSRNILSLLFGLLILTLGFEAIRAII